MKSRHACVVVWLVAFGPLLATACAAADSPEVSVTGQVRVALIGTSSSGLTYRLRHARFEISGASHASLSTEADPNATSLQKELRAGDYLVRLESGWYLEKQTSNGVFERVKAVLSSANPVSFTILDQQTANVRFRFRTGDGVLEFGDGRLVVGIDVDEGAPGCRLHADCASRACDTYAADGHGACIAQARVLYAGGNCTYPGTGTMTDPFCRIQEAIPAVSSSKDVIRVLPGMLQPFAVSGKRLQLLGPAGEGGIASVSEVDTAAIAVSAGANVVIDGFTIGSHTGLSCNSSRAVLRRSSVRSEGTAIYANDCDVELDRVIIHNWLGAILFVESRFLVTNTFVGGPTRAGAAITIQGGAGSFRFSTFSAGHDPDEATRGVMDCGASSILIQDSIVVGNGLFSDTGSHFRGACVLDHVVVGDDPVVSPGAIHKTALLSDDYHLSNSAQNLDCCIDQPIAGAGVPFDIEGTSRPQGPRFDLGAYEVVRP